MERKKAKASLDVDQWLVRRNRNLDAEREA